MLGFLYRTIIGRFSRCEHEWEEISRGPVQGESGKVIGHYFYLRCKKCGDIKERQFVS